MGPSVCNLLHKSVSCDGSSVNWERTHHADQITFKKSLPSTKSVLLFEATPHGWIPELPKLVRLHQGLDIVKGIVEHPIHRSTHSSGDHRHINRDIVSICSNRCQLFCQLFDEGKVKAKASGLSDCCCCLAPIESLKPVLLEDLHHRIQRSSVDFISLAPLDLHSDPGVLNWTLTSLFLTTSNEDKIPVAKAAIVLSASSRVAGTPLLPFQLAMSFLIF